jgi:hypothetical protein
LVEKSSQTPGAMNHWSGSWSTERASGRSTMWLIDQCA